MNCPNCKQEIEDNSVFCEYCGTKIEKSGENPQTNVEDEVFETVKEDANSQGKQKFKIKKWQIFTAAGVFLVVMLAGIHLIKARNFSHAAVENWVGGNGTYFVLKDNSGTKLVRLKSTFPLSYKTLEEYNVVDLKIYCCKGDHSGMGAFAALHESGMVDFILDYGRGGLYPNGGWTCLSNIGVTDEEHLYGYTDDIQYGESEHNVKNLFNYMCQPVNMVSYDLKWHFIDVDGNEKFPGAFDDAYPFSYGFARVQKDGRWYYIKTDGSELQLNLGGNYMIYDARDFYYDFDFNAPVLYIKWYANGTDYQGYVNTLGDIVQIQGQQIFEQAAE